MIPVPLVSVRNCERKPIRPRAGMRNSSRTRPLPLLTILVIVPRRMPHCAMTTPWKSSATSMTEILDRLHDLAVDDLGDDVGAGDLELEALAAHHLDQDRELQLAAAQHFHLLRRVGRLDLDRHVAEQLAIEPVLDLPRGHELPFAPRHRRGVDAEDHRHGRLVDRRRRHRQAMLDVGDGFADGDVLDAGQTDDVAGQRRPAMSTRRRPSKANSLVTLVSWNVPSSLHTVIGSPTFTRPLKIRPIAIRPR